MKLESSYECFRPGCRWITRKAYRGKNAGDAAHRAIGMPGVSAATTA